MTKLPVVSGKDLCKLFNKIGYEIDHQTGSHIVVRNNNYPFRRLTIPNHKVVAKGTLRAIIREAGLSIEEFTNLNLKK